MSYKVLDVANKLLNHAENISKGEDLMTNMKLQKMLYYQQGYHLAYFNEPLFEDEIEAWMYGPVVPGVYEYYKKYGRQGIESDKSNVLKFEKREEEALFEEVYIVYSKYSALGLMNMTHEEYPWKSTDTGEGNIITKEKMKEFFKDKLKK